MECSMHYAGGSKTDKIQRLLYNVTWVYSYISHIIVLIAYITSVCMCEYRNFVLLTFCFLLYSMLHLVWIDDLCECESIHLQCVFVFQFFLLCFFSICSQFICRSISGIAMFNVTAIWGMFVTRPRNLIT